MGRSSTPRNGPIHVSPLNGPGFPESLFVKPLKKEVEAEPTRLMGDTEEARPLTPDTTPRLPRRTLPTLFFSHQ